MVILYIKWPLFIYLHAEVGTFRKLMSALVDSMMLYGVEIWGCTRSLEVLEQVQLCAFHISLSPQFLYISSIFISSFPMVVCAVLHWPMRCPSTFWYCAP